jgi:hypothetical protein
VSETVPRQPSCRGSKEPCLLIPALSIRAGPSLGARHDSPCSTFLLLFASPRCRNDINGLAPSKPTRITSTIRVPLVVPLVFPLRRHDVADGAGDLLLLSHELQFITTHVPPSGLSRPSSES